jgi:hypothetical protein
MIWKMTLLIANWTGIQSRRHTVVFFVASSNYVVKCISSVRATPEACPE